MLPTTSTSLLDKDYDKAPGSTIKIEDVDYGALEQLNLNRGTALQNANGGHRGAFEHVPFQESTFSFDDKYNMQGRFAFDVDELPIHSNYGDRSSHRENQLSKTSFCPGKSPMEDSVTTG